MDCPPLHPVYPAPSPKGSASHPQSLECPAGQRAWARPAASLQGSGRRAQGAGLVPSLGFEGPSLGGSSGAHS